MFTSLSLLFLLTLSAIVAAAPTGKWFDKYVVVVFENMDLTSILSNRVFSDIASSGILQSNYHGVTHPSQPNYWGLIAAAANFPGDTYEVNTSIPFNVTGDNGDYPIDIYYAKTIVDLLEPAGLTYKVYEENYPTPGECYLADGYGNESAQQVANYNPSAYGISPTNRLYRRKHNPFISFKTFTHNQTRCQNQRDFIDLYDDIAAGTLPDFSFVVPNEANDNHDTTINYTAIWYDQFVSHLNNSPLYNNSRVLVHVVYDEDDTAYTYYDNAEYNDAGQLNPYYKPNCYYNCAPAGCTNLLHCTLDKNNNKVYSVLFGSAIPQMLVGTTDVTNYSHYSVSATLEANWGLGSLNRYDTTANVFAIQANFGSSTGSATSTGTTTSSTNRSATDQNGSVGYSPISGGSSGGKNVTTSNTTTGSASQVNNSTTGATSSGTFFQGSFLRGVYSFWSLVIALAWTCL